MFPSTQVVTAVAKRSNHSPLILNLEATSAQSNIKRQRIFRFEAMWTREGLIGWDKSSFGHVRMRVKELDKQLEVPAKDPIVSSYYHNLFQTSNPTDEAMDEVLRGMPTRVSESMNEALIQPFVPDEVKLVISQMYPYKSPGPNGMSPVFYQKYWHIVGPEKFGYFHPQRGPREGDPLSPYLFLLCAEAFSHLITTAENLGELSGVAISQNGPRMSYLLFADDTMIFCQATQEAMQVVGQILKEFKAASCLLVNLEKSSITFSRNTPDNLQEDLASTLGVHWYLSMKSTWASLLL
ncbi:UNVERIFIED_CONTAM: putative mitochondrial protein [Sesamum latifolium]|uniref:Mitochondrial protein n=1 Tax=Sesamum latifolium TaxID=2727402 RepID=A0AAW2WTK4_9LAMI